MTNKVSLAINGQARAGEVEPGVLLIPVVSAHRRKKSSAAMIRSQGRLSIRKVAHPASGCAVMGIAVRLKTSGGTIIMARIEVTRLGPHALRARNAEALLEGGAGLEAAAAVVGDGIDANSDLYASAEYGYLARVHAARGLRTPLSRAE